MYGIWNQSRFEWMFGIEEPTYWKAYKALEKVVGPRDVKKKHFEVKLMSGKVKGRAV